MAPSSAHAARILPLPPDDVGGPRQPLLVVQNLSKSFLMRGGAFARKSRMRAVDAVSFDVLKNETLAIVGESGSGKSTMARLLMRLVEPDSGTVVFDGQEVGGLRGVSVRELRRSVQMVFQDSHATLNPRLPIGDTVAFGPRAMGASAQQAKRRASESLHLVGLQPAVFYGRYPHELSGGQRQRANIARALALKPRALILDEAVSALDKSVEAQIINLLQDLKRTLRLTYLFISHDLDVVRYLADRVLVMYRGRVMEIAPVERLFAEPRHPYTRSLLDSSLRSGRPSLQRTEIPEETLESSDAVGCRFRLRCPIAEPRCGELDPPLRELESGLFSACLAASGAHSARREE